MTELNAGDTFHWFNSELKDPWAKKHHFDNIGDIQYHPWSTRDGFVLFGTTEKLSDGKTPRTFVLLDTDDVVLALIPVTDTPNAIERADRAIEKAKENSRR